MRKYQVIIYRLGGERLAAVDVIASSKEHARVLGAPLGVEHVFVLDLGPVHLPFDPQGQPAEAECWERSPGRWRELYWKEREKSEQLRQDIQGYEQSEKRLRYELKVSRDNLLAGLRERVELLDKPLIAERKMRYQAEHEVKHLVERNKRLEELNGEGSALVHSLKTQLTLALQAIRDVEDRR